MENEMEINERQAVERELSMLMEVTLNLENELHTLISQRRN
jgi:hypothetical protein